MSADIKHHQTIVNRTQC